MWELKAKQHQQRRWQSKFSWAVGHGILERWFCFGFCLFWGGSYHGVTHVDLCESKADCTKQTVTFLLKAWALLPKAASVGGCLAFSVSFGLKRAPEERFTYKRVNKFGVTNSSIFVFISFVLELHVHYSPEWADFLYHNKRHRWPQKFDGCLPKGSLSVVVSLVWDMR